MNQLKSTFLKGSLFLILAQVMVGINIVFVKYVLPSMPILSILTIRFSLAALILFVLYYIAPTKKKPLYHYFSNLKRRDWFFIIAQALSAGVLFNCLMLWGLNYTDANVAGIITSALPVIVALLSWLMLGEKISRTKMICVILATIGLVVIAVDKLIGSSNAHSLLGDVIVFVSLFPEAAYYVLSKMYTHSMPIFLISSILNAINAVILMIIIGMSANIDFHMSFSDFSILVLLAVSSALFYVFWYMGCQKVDGVMSSLSTAVMPAATVIMAWVFLGEKLTLGQSLGMGMVMLSIVLYSKMMSQSKKEIAAYAEAQKLTQEK